MLEKGEVDLERSRNRLQEAVGEGFVVGELIGRGGFAEVFRAREVSLNRDVAVKVIRPDLLPTPDLAPRFKREAQAIASLRAEAQ